MIKHKFKARRTNLDGIKFSSKKEANRYDILKLLKKSGEILFFLRQVPFHLPGGVKYVCDFLIFWANGEVTIEDVKGFKTESYKTKKKMVEALYPIDISEV
jgi:dsDNA-binding SOS-regulon protein